MGWSESYGVIGLGRFGSALAKKLAESGKEVIVADSNENKVRELRSYTDYAYVVKELSREALAEIGIQNCDTVIVCIAEAVDTSILVTMNVINMGVRRVISKAVSNDQGAVLKKIGAQVVYPERDMALRIAEELTGGNILDTISLEDDVAISEIRITGKMAGRSILKSHIRDRYGLNIIALEPGNRTEIEVDPNYVLKDGDSIVVIGKNENIRQLEEGMQE